ncbi:MAG: ImmA/IrrE family metallo-endopeptidase [Oscillospiraceae bacterium]|nr:ImmA/IrrE family metallo-endopeptidase [Oscillospiraceae bacterium]
MIDYYDIVAQVAALKRDFPCMKPEEIIEERGIALLEIPMGSGPNALKGFIQKNSRLRTIVVNSDLPYAIKHKILFHELGHNERKHLELIRTGTLADTDISYRKDHTLAARYENEANFFAAECTLDTAETLEVISEYDLVTAARLLRVPLEFLDYKLRLMHHTGQLDRYVDVFSVRSDCLLKIGNEGYEN